MTYSLLLPHRSEAGPGPYAVLYLLHPFGGDHADWLLNTRVEQYVKRLPLIVALPSLYNSLGCDTASGEPYEHFFADEFMAQVEATGLTRHGRENTAIAGAGSGGYAALRMAFAYPYWFGAAASLSGDVCAPQEEKLRQLPDGPARAARYRPVFGEPDHPRRKYNDLFRLAEGLSNGKAPALMLDCGSEDPLLPHNRDLRRRLSGFRIRHEFSEPKGGHNWNYWEERLPATLSFLSRALGLKEEE